MKISSYLKQFSSISERLLGEVFKNMVIHMKRVGNLYNIFISDENILMAIREVNKTHRAKFGKLNSTVKRVEMDLDKAV